MQINIIAILIAVVANFFLGFIWYTPLFGKIWAKEMGYNENNQPKKSDFIKGMIFMVIGNFLFAYVFAHNIAAWSFVPETKEMSATANAVMSAFFTWLGFYLPGDLGSTAWERKSWKLFGINTAYHFMSLLLVAFILIYMN